MRIKSKFGVEKYLEFSRGWCRELFKFENFILFDATDENGVMRFIVLRQAGNNIEYFELDLDQFYELIVLYLGGRTDFFLMHRLYEELNELTTNVMLMGDSEKEVKDDGKNLC